MTETKSNYQATFVLDTREREDSVDDLIASLKEEISSVGGEVSEVENLGKQDFAQAPDRRYESGVYARFRFSGDSDTPSRILEKLRLNKLVSHKMIQRV